MKKLFRTMLCAAVAAAALCVSAFAADTVPAKQGDFYVEVNGQYVTFADAVPQLKDGRSFLPFVAVFDQPDAQKAEQPTDLPAEKQEPSL